MLTTTIMACKAPKLISPAMNTNMYENEIVQDNLKKLKSYGYEIIDPASGYLACGDTGAGKMPEPAVLLSYILRTVACEKDMTGKKVLITAGPTQEKIDPVRYITNHSTGKMGYALAENCMLRGAAVTLVTGPVALTPPPFVEVVSVVTAADMAEAVKAKAAEQDIIIKAAAVADYTPANPSDEKIKKQDGASSIALTRTEDILAWLGEHRSAGQFICGFSMETENMLENSRAKLAKKKVDMIVANNLKVTGAGFGTDTNVVTIITKDHCRELSIMSKADVAAAIVNEILEKIK
jgi:phosphopantothenoylcysteine decarboxylase/phosphopantothenate--cysteine ligase